MSEPTLFRIGSAFLVLGALLGVVVNVLHPRPSDYDSLTSIQLVAATDSGLWIGDHVGILLAVLLIVGGQLAFYRSLSGERALAFGRLGAGSALVSAAVWSVLVAADGIAVKRLADVWTAAAAADKAGSLGAALAVNALSGGLFIVATVLSFGVTSVLFGLAIALGDTYPRWLGWVGVVLGAAAALVGLVQAYQGPSQLVTTVLFTSVSLALTVWLFAIGVLLWRRTVGVGATARAMA